MQSGIFNRITGILAGFFLATVFVIAQHPVSYDTIIIYNPETYEETMKIVKNELTDEPCYIFVFGKVPFEKAKMEAGEIVIGRQTAIDNIKEGIRVDADNSCPKVNDIQGYTVETLQSNGQVTAYTFDQMQDYLTSNPVVFERILHNAKAMIFKDVTITLEDGSTKNLGDFEFVLADQSK